MIIIGLSGKIGVGKTAIADLLTACFFRGCRVAFADALKVEAAEIYGFDHALTKTAEGKDTIIQSALLPGGSASVRQVLILHGQNRRSDDPGYWSEIMYTRLVQLAQLGCSAAIIDDVRFENEMDFLLKFGAGSILVRIEPYPGWVPGQHAQDESETALDHEKRFDLILRPDFGPDGLAEAVSTIANYIVVTPPEASHE